MRHAVVDVAFKSVVDQLHEMPSGEVSSQELVELHLERIATHDPALNAAVTLDLDRARREAAEADAARSAGQSLGPLHGVPVTTRDSLGNQDVKAGNPAFGPSSHPWAGTRTSGGSAGRGAVATAAGLTAFDFGSETGGSTRIGRRGP
jgi:amidase